MNRLKTFDDHKLWLALQATDKYDVLRVTAALSIAYFISSCIYNRYFHPLAKFPGPFLASITNLYHVWLYWHVAAEHLVDEELHRLYGPVVRKGVNFLSVSDASMLPHIYGMKAWKPEMFYIPEAWTGTSARATVVQLDPKEHAANRRKVTPPFQPKAMAAVKPLVQARVAEWTEKNMKFAEEGRAVDWTLWCQSLAYDVISELVYGEPFGFIAAERDVHGLLSQFYQGVKMGGALLRLPGLCKFIIAMPFSRYLLPNPKDTWGLGKIMGIRDKYIHHRLENPTDKPDVLNHLLAYRDENGAPMPLEDLKLEAFVMMNAGSETTSSTLCNFTLNMLRFPHVHKKIMATDLSPENLARENPEFPYLNAVIKETLRWCHPAAALLPRQTAPDGEGVVMPDGRRIPPGTDVNMNIHVVMRDKNIYGQDAAEFVPERWLVDSGWGSVEDVKRIEKYNFVWSYGPRICLGKPLAEMELLMATKDLLVNFEFEYANPEKPWSHMTNYSALMYHDLYLRLKKRVA